MKGRRGKELYWRCVSSFEVYWAPGLLEDRAWVEGRAACPLCLPSPQQSLCRLCCRRTLISQKFHSLGPYEFIANIFFSSVLFFLILFYFLTLQYCIGFARYQYESATGIHVFPILNPPPSSLLPPRTIPLGRPSAPAPSIQYHASNLDWWFVSSKISNLCWKFREKILRGFSVSLR